MKFRVFWDILPCSQIDLDRRFRGSYCIISAMKEAVRTSETSANIYLTTWQYIPEDSEQLYQQPIVYLLKSIKAQLMTLNS
jgi:hypothetical protein